MVMNLGLEVGAGLEGDMMLILLNGLRQGKPWSR